MRLIAPLVLAGISCAAPVLAGPHAGGSLILHVNSDVVYTTDAESWCGSSGITSCEDAVTQATASPDSIRVFFALAAFSEWSTPRLRGITFGINYDSTAVAILATGTCADFEISTPTWPSPNSGTALTWYQPQTTHLTEVCWFAGYAYDESTPSSVALQAHPVQGGQFADDSVPAALDDISGYGVLGFGMPGMIPGCGAGEWGGGGTGNAPDGGGGEDGGGQYDLPDPKTLAALKAIKRDGSGVIVERTELVPPSPGLVSFGVARGAIETVLPGHREVETLEFTGADVQAVLAATPSIEVHRTFPTFSLSDTTCVRPDGERARVPDLTRVFTASFDVSIPPDTVAQHLRECESVLWADLHWPPIPSSTPDDPKFTSGLQWSLPRVGLGPTADAVWEKSMRPTPSWRIGVLDGGFDPSHVDLGGGFGPGKKIRSAYSYHPSLPVDGCLPVYVQHGNNSTGVLGALTDNNQVGVASIGGGFDPAYLGPELALLATWCNGRDDFPAAIVDATAAALPDGQPANCRIISYSAGNYVWHESERLACFTAYQRGSLLCAAKGNHGDELHHYPADYDQHWTLSVGASARLPDWRISKEVFGWGSNYGYSIDLVAPGIDIPTTDLNHGYRDNYSATSAATPLAASAAAALQLNADFTLTPEDIQGLLKAGCSDVLDDLRHPEPTLHGPDEYTGAGRLDVAASLALLSPPNVFMQLESDPSQNTWETWGWRYVTFIEGARPLPFPEGVWMAFPVEVTAHVQYPAPFIQPPHAWVVGSRSSGVSLNSPNYGEGSGYFGSTTQTGCTAYGITYLVLAPGFIGYWPDVPELVKVGVSVVGQLSVSDAPESAQLDREVSWHVQRSVGTSARFAFPSGVPVGMRMELYSVAGRRVREITPPVVRGAHFLDWDGRDDAGRACPAGIYWARSTGVHTGRHTARVILVR